MLGRTHDDSPLLLGSTRATPPGRSVVDRPGQSLGILAQMSAKLHELPLHHAEFEDAPLFGGSADDIDSARL